MGDSLSYLDNLLVEDDPVQIRSQSAVMANSKLDCWQSPIYRVPLFQNESKTFHLKMSLICMKINL